MKIKNLLIILSSLFLSFSAYAGGHKYTGPDLSGQKVVMFGPWLSLVAATNVPAPSTGVPKSLVAYAGK